jgi:hypothetical protein
MFGKHSDGIGVLDSTYERGHVQIARMSSILKKTLIFFYLFYPIPLNKHVLNTYGVHMPRIVFPFPLPTKDAPVCTYFHLKYHLLTTGGLQDFRTKSQNNSLTMAN